MAQLLFYSVPLDDEVQIIAPKNRQDIQRNTQDNQRNNQDIQISKPFLTPEGNLFRAIRTSPNRVIVRSLASDSLLGEVIIQGTPDGEMPDPQAIPFIMDTIKRIVTMVLGEKILGGSGNGGGNQQCNTTVTVNVSNNSSINQLNFNCGRQ